MYVEDLKRDSNPAKGGRPKDIFEMGSNKSMIKLVNKNVRIRFNVDSGKMIFYGGKDLITEYYLFFPI